MEYILHFVSTGSVLLLNGSFVQSATAVRYDSAEPLFVTVLPLDAAYLPYTVELVGGVAATNSHLALCCDMGGGHKYIELKNRSAFVYSPEASFRRPAPDSAPAQLLEFVKSGNFEAARAMMSSSLSDSVSDSALTDFFDGVLAVRENVYTPERGYLLIKEDGTAPRCEIEVRGGLIENIVL